jgi:hypothetical protein
MNVLAYHKRNLNSYIHIIINMHRSMHKNVWRDRKVLMEGSCRVQYAVWGLMLLTAFKLQFKDRGCIMWSTLWRYKPEGRRFDSRWSHGRHRHERKWVPGILPGGKGGRCIVLTSFSSWADCLEISEPEPPGIVRIHSGL